MKGGGETLRERLGCARKREVRVRSVKMKMLATDSNINPYVQTILHRHLQPGTRA